MNLGFYLGYATRSLRREGQRTLLAIMCIAFGVMSVVSMQLLAGSIKQAILGDPRAFLGGDVMLYNNNGTLTDAQLQLLQRLKADGRISAFSLEAANDSRLIQNPANGEVYVLNASPIGVDPAVYPLVGTIHFSDPNATLAALLATPFDAVLTSDLAGKLDLATGDSFLLVGSAAAAPQTMRVAGISIDFPGSRGDSMIYSMQTATLLSGQASPANWVAVTWPSGQDAMPKLESDQWFSFTAAQQAENNAAVSEIFSFGLKGAGILGLFVGGIGVANTLQVLLARRTLEIATLKTLGFSRRALLLLFGLETALLGLAGSVVGIAVALLITGGFLRLLAETGSIMLQWNGDPLVLLGGLLLGVATALIFGLFTIARASSVRPATLLRQLPVRRDWGTRLASGALLGVLLVLTLAISSLIMGSLWDGSLVIGGALVGLLVLTLAFGATLLLALGIPTPGIGLLTLARRNLRSQMLRAIFALIALWAGVFAIGFAGNVFLSASNRVAGLFSSSAGPSLTIYGRQADQQAIEAALAAQGVVSTTSSLRVAATITDQANKSIPIGYIDGRQALNSPDFSVTSGRIVAADDALVPGYLSNDRLKIGDRLTVAAGGKTSSLRVAGFYDATPRQHESWADGVIVAEPIALELSSPNAAVVYTGQAPEQEEASKSEALGKALPGAIVVSRKAIDAAANRNFESLFTFVAALASLALVAGGVLIANGVGLAMTQRRREMGILKAVGFSAGRVLSALLIENTLLGFLAGILGMIGVAIAVVAVNVLEPGAQLTLDPPFSALMVLAAMLIALLSTALVAWRPIRIRPLEVLRAE